MILFLLQYSSFHLIVLYIFCTSFDIKLNYNIKDSVSCFFFFLGVGQFFFVVLLIFALHFILNRAMYNLILTNK